MRRFLFLALGAVLLCPFLSAQTTVVGPSKTDGPTTAPQATASSTWSIVNKGLVYAGHPLGSSLALGWTTGSGNQLVVVIGLAGTGAAAATVSSVVDDGSGGSSTYVTVGAGARGTSTAVSSSSEIWCSAVKSGVTHLTVNSATSSLNGYAYVYEISGLLSCPTPDKLGNQSNVTGSGTSNAGASLSLTVVGDFICSIDLPNAGAITGVSSAGWTSDDTSTGVGFAHFTSNAATATAHQVTFVNTNSGDDYETSDAALEP